MTQSRGRNHGQRQHHGIRGHSYNNSRDDSGLFQDDDLELGQERTPVRTQQSRDDDEFNDLNMASSDENSVISIEQVN